MQVTEDKCTCGHSFVGDDAFCPKCGRKRIKNAWRPMPLNMIHDNKKIEMFDELYGSALNHFERTIAGEGDPDDDEHYLYEATMRILAQGCDVESKAMWDTINRQGD